MVTEYKNRRYKHNKTINMSYLIEWFQINYPQLCRDLLNCNHNASDRNLNPYHLESDCWSHTMLVCKVAEIHGYSKEVQIAALLHDIGKPASRKINPRNNHVQFFGHEELSAKMSEDILVSMMQKNIINKKESLEIKELIALHSVLHKVKDPHELFKLFEHKKTLYIHLVQLNRCDALGRFCADMNFDTKKYDTLISFAKNMDNQ